MWWTSGGTDLSGTEKRRILLKIKMLLLRENDLR